MSTISKNVNTGNYELNITPTTTDQTTTLKVGGTYCDTDIDVKVSAIPGSYIVPSGNIELTTNASTDVTSKATATVRNASSFSLAITDQPTTNITVGSISSGYYPLTASLTGTFSASTAGWFSSGSATDNSVIVGRIPASTHSTSDERITPYAWSIDTSADSIDRYYNFTEGYTKPGYIKIRARTNGSFNNAATSGVTYTENTAAGTVIPANGYLYLNAGYFPNTKISLAHLIPDPSTGEANPGTNDIRSGKVAYDGDGNKIVGTMADVIYGSATTTDPTGTNQTTVTPSNSTQYVSITAGYTGGGKITINAINAVLTINGSSPDANGNALISKTGATTSETMPSALIQGGSFLKLVRVRS